MVFEDLPGQVDSLTDRNVRKPEETTVGLVVTVDQRPEVRVQGDEDTILPIGDSKQLVVPRIRAELPGFEDVVSL